MHEHLFIHRDMKPDNFLLGNDTDSSTIFLIDFGLAKLYRNPTSGEHIPYRDKKHLTGTARYASIPTHMGFEQGRRDDLEGICYIMLYFLKGHLPWQGLPATNKENKYKRIMEVKVKNTSEILCEGLPGISEFIICIEEIRLMIKYCRNLKFEENPNYSYLYRLIQDIFQNNKLECDYKYDWMSSPVMDTETSLKAIITDTSKSLLPNLNQGKNNKLDVVNKERVNKETRKEAATPEIIVNE